MNDRIADKLWPPRQSTRIGTKTSLHVLEKNPENTQHNTVFSAFNMAEKNQSPIAAILHRRKVFENRAEPIMVLILSLLYSINVMQLLNRYAS